MQSYQLANHLFKILITLSYEMLNYYTSDRLSNINKLASANFGIKVWYNRHLLLNLLTLVSQALTWYVCTNLFSLPILPKQLGAAEPPGVRQGRGRAARPAQPARARTRRLCLTAGLFLVLAHHYHGTTRPYTRNQIPRYQCFTTPVRIVFPVNLPTIHDNTISPQYITLNSQDSS